MPYSVYAAGQAFYREAFIAAFAASTSHSLVAVYITNFQASSQGTTLIYFDTIMQGSDYDVAAAAAAVQALFNLTDPSCSATTPVGCPAFSALTTAMVSKGLPAAGVFYNDQLSISNYFANGAGPIIAAEVGTWQFADSNEVLALDISYSIYATNQQFFKE
jgi:hypothetical protein